MLTLLSPAGAKTLVGLAPKDPEGHLMPLPGVAWQVPSLIII